MPGVWKTWAFWRVGAGVGVGVWLLQPFKTPPYARGFPGVKAKMCLQIHLAKDSCCKYFVVISDNKYIYQQSVYLSFDDDYEQRGLQVQGIFQAPAKKAFTKKLKAAQAQHQISNSNHQSKTSQLPTRSVSYSQTPSAIEGDGIDVGDESDNDIEIVENGILDNPTAIYIHRGK